MPVLTTRALATNLRLQQPRASLAKMALSGQNPEKWHPRVGGEDPGWREPERARVEDLGLPVGPSIPQPSRVPWKGSVPFGRKQQTGLSWPAPQNTEEQAGGGGLRS